MKDGTMFGSFPDFENADYCREHSQITFDTLYRPGSYRLFAVVLDQVPVEGSEHEKDIYYNFIDAEDEAAFDTYLENLQNYAIYYDAEHAPLFGDEILTLSTCNYHTDDGRLALIAVRTDQ
jgi:sortase B